jgi:hypothetical protein
MNSENNPAYIVSKFINNTDRNIFLTGKAGTGKTTFLRNISHQTHKNVIVAAPTGIAAINAGGVTLHSLFQLPFGAFIPTNNALSNQNITSQISTPQSLLNSFQMHKTKRNMLRELELLIIDEVSMLRADLLDAIDVTLRFVRKQRNEPFGGVQILFIGDLLQLPPVVKDNEWSFLSEHYDGMYFFNAQVLKNNQLLYVELDKIYRQTDSTFISLLNNLRNNTITPSDVELLNQHYDPTFQQKEDEGYILLTTHNRIADEKNKQALSKIKNKSFFFKAKIEGDFNEYMFPVEEKLELKQGAQVMFIKNDSSGEQRYFNGKIGTVSKLDNDEIIVSFPDGSEPTLVELYTWENKKYTLQKETNIIEEETVGTFKHYPLKLAWAITVHKSQGLTFDKAIIDVSKAFAPGQIYVALSRLTSLDGLVLTSPVPTSGLNPDNKLIEFIQTKQEPENLTHLFKKEAKLYTANFVLQSFNFNRMVNDLSYHISTYTKDENRSLKQQYKSWAAELLAETNPLKKVADSFQVQLKQIITSDEENYLSHLHERITAAINYFEPLIQKLSDKVFDKINDLSGQKGIKKYLNELQDVDNLFYRQLQLIYKAQAFINSAIQNSDISKESIQEPAMANNRKKAINAKPAKTLKNKQKKEKGPNTKDVSFNLYKEGKTIEQIAQEREMVTTTIEGHLAHFVREGLIDVNDLIPEEKYKKIAEVVKELETINSAPIKAQLGTNYSYGEIKMAIAGILAEERNNK